MVRPLHKSILKFILLGVLVFPNACKEEQSIPTITSIFPEEGFVDTGITITGTNFSPNISGNTVKINGTIASIQSCTGSIIVVTVPQGATTGRVTVAVNGGGTATSTDDFTVNNDPGVIEKYYKSNKSTLTIQTLNFLNGSYSNTAVFKSGMHFKVDKEMRVKAVGGMFAKTGNYYIELIAVGLDVIPHQLLYSATINANKTGTFVFGDVTSALVLKPETEYLLRYCDDVPNHVSIYDLWFANQPNGSLNFLQPFDFGPLTLTTISNNYTVECSLPFYGAGRLESSKLLMRGIVDLKFEGN